MVTAMTVVACGSVGPASSTPTPTPLARLVGYTLPSGCDLVGSSYKKNDNTTYWGVRCSEPGVLSIVLAPSFASQGWEPCAVAGGRAWFRTKDWLITVTTVPTTEQGEIGEAPRIQGCGPMPDEP
jgi:hypothetical protein